MSLLMFSLTCPLISNALPPMAPGTGSWQSPAQDLNIFKRALGTHVAKPDAYDCLCMFVIASLTISSYLHLH